MRRVMRLVKPYIKYIIYTVIASIICMLSNVAINNLIKEQINVAARNAEFNYGMLAVQIIVILVSGMISSYFMTFLNGYYSNNIMADVRKSVVAHIRNISIGEVEKCNYGDMISRMSIDMESIKSYAESYLKDCIYVPIMIIGFSIYLIYENFMLYISTMIPLLVLVPLSVKLMSPIKFRQKEYVKTMGRTNDNIHEICSGIITVKAYGLEDELYQKYRHKLGKSLKMSQDNDRLQYMIQPLSYLITYLPVVICLVFGGKSVFEGKMTFGTLVVYSNMLGLLINPLIEAYQLYVNSKSAFASIERVLEIMDIPLEDEKVDTALNEASISGKDMVYELNNVSYAYGDKNVLKDISLKIGKGSKVALVGQSGSGKSTLLKLLYKHYDNYDGYIKMHGIDMKTLTATQIRDEVALISQDTYLFPISIMDNILMANENATVDEVINAAKIVGAHEFIESLTNGYDTNAGEAGELLSGGQKQRIAMARAVLKHSEIILLDEPTSALDKESEDVITKMIDRVFKEKTVITVAHRLPTIKEYDQIIVMNNAQIIDWGTHQSLLESNITYRNMWDYFVNEKKLLGMER